MYLISSDLPVHDSQKQSLDAIFPSVKSLNASISVSPAPRLCRASDPHAHSMVHVSQLIIWK